MKKNILLLSVIFLFLIPFMASGKAGKTEEKFFEISAKRFEYTPQKIRVKRGDRVTIRLISEDVTHGLYLDGYGLETSAHPGSDGSLTFTADRTGRFTFRCSMTCGEFHPFMVGYLVVGPNLRFYGFAGIALALGAGSVSRISARRKEKEVKV